LDVAKSGVFMDRSVWSIRSQELFGNQVFALDHHVVETVRLVRRGWSDRDLALKEWTAYRACNRVQYHGRRDCIVHGWRCRLDHG
jgi:hypothetical protein